MANKLKNLEITSVDLVDKGANQDAHVRLFKRQEPDTEPKPDATPTQSDEGVIKNFISAVLKMLSPVPKNAGVEANINPKEETDTMKIDKSKMSAEELKVLSEIEKKYGLPDEPSANVNTDAAANTITEPSDNTSPTTTENSVFGKNLSTLHPDVKKALDELEDYKKSMTAQVEEMSRAIEVERLTGFAKRYEILGKTPDELAKKLYELKKSGGTAYDDYVGLLDEHITLVEKSGLFSEVGRNGSGGSGAWGELASIASEIAKRDGCTMAQAIDKAGAEHPSLLSEYRKGI